MFDTWIHYVGMMRQPENLGLVKVLFFLWFYAGHWSWAQLPPLFSELFLSILYFEIRLFEVYCELPRFNAYSSCRHLNNNKKNRSILQLDCNLCVGCKKTNIGGWIRDPSVSFIKVSHCLLATKISTKRMIHPWTASSPRIEVCVNVAPSDNDLQMQPLNF